MKNGEKKIITLSILGTVLIILGFTLSQQSGTDSKEYVSVTSDVISENKSEVSKDDYKIVSNDEKDGIITYNIHCKKDFNSKEIATLTGILKEENKEMTDNYRIYLFSTEEKEIEKRISPVGKNSIKISEYYTVENQIESIPKEFDILSVNKTGEYTFVESIIEDVDKPEVALAQIKFLGENIKKENANKEIGTLNIISYDSKDKTKGWEYDGKNKSQILRNQYEEMM